MRLIDTKPGKRFRQLVLSGMAPAKAVVDAGFADPRRALVTLLRQLENETAEHAALPDHEVRRLALRAVLSDPRASAEAKLQATRQLRAPEFQPRPQPVAAPDAAPAPNNGFLRELIGRVAAPLPATAPADAPSPESAPIDFPVPAVALELPPEHVRVPEPAEQVREREPAPAPVPAPIDAQAEQARMLEEIEARRTYSVRDTASAPADDSFEAFRERYKHLHSDRLIEICAAIGHRLEPTEDREALLRAAHRIYLLPERRALPPVRPKLDPQREADRLRSEYLHALKCQWLGPPRPANSDPNRPEPARVWTGRPTWRTF